MLSMGKSSQAVARLSPRPNETTKGFLSHTYPEKNARAEA